MHAGKDKLQQALEEEKKRYGSVEPRKQQQLTSRRPVNSFAMSCAILASFNSWLIGYGK